MIEKPTSNTYPEMLVQQEHYSVNYLKSVITRIRYLLAHPEEQEFMQDSVERQLVYLERIFQRNDEWAAALADKLEFSEPSGLGNCKSCGQDFKLWVRVDEVFRELRLVGKRENEKT